MLLQGLCGLLGSVGHGHGLDTADGRSRLFFAARFIAVASGLVLKLIGAARGLVPLRFVAARGLVPPLL